VSPLDVDKLRYALLFLVALVASVAVHEFGHAFVADRLGDPTPRAQGRVTLNPIAHADLFGTLLIPLVSIYTGAALIGWGKPVQTNPRAYRRWRGRVGDVAVSLAGPVMNLVLALVASLVVVALARAGQPLKTVGVAVTLVEMNLGLFFFNLLPVPPLDGGAVFAGIMPRSLARPFALVQQYGFLVLFALVMTPLFGYVMWPARWLTAVWIRLLVG
jgi:Zn-dependent protease